MNSIVYAFLAYGVTALISLLMVGVIVIVNHLMSGNSRSENEQGAD